MKFTNIALCLFSAAIVAAEGDENLPKLRIGITKKIAADKCTVKAKSGDTVQVHYTGKLEDGTVFDSSYNRGQPLDFPLGVGRVIEGWDQGILGMCLGEKRKLTIPPHLGYGSHGAGNVIPPDATLIFLTELVGINGEKYEEDAAATEEVEEKEEPAAETEEKEEL